ncbi:MULTISPECIES: MerR family transcriptional regulator [unclassified Luteibacter]|jgi:DNA-binding transcriptional MerR regulator|uniref:MerR family transcriptional regulator n=1 Tax=unclassified Luteibacter TaxID=2620188 RepID=UPI00056A1110|nr:MULTISPECIES: MerR family transcriptional regulator [unclassified Luteibacter]
MTTTLTIAEAALATGLTVHTLRYYEQIGLIDPVPRRSGQRIYGENELAMLRFVVHMRATGMSMRTLQEYSELRREGETPESIRRRGDLLARHAAFLRGELVTLTETIARLDTKIAMYRSAYGESGAAFPDDIPSPSARKHA